MIVVVFVVSVLVFVLGRAVVPGDVSQLLVGTQGASPEQVAEIRARLGLDDPVYVAYAEWLRGAVTGDFGISPVSGQTVSSQLKQQVPVSLELALISLFVTAALGIPLGIAAAARSGGRLDGVIRLVLLSAFAIPSFVTAIVLVYIGAAYLGDLYQTDYVTFREDPAKNLQSMILPVIAVSVPTVAVTVQLTRSAMLEALSRPYVVTARAKGASPRSITFIHALKYAAPGILTFLAILFGGLIGGVVVVENVFNLPGLGRGIVRAIEQRDFQLLVPQTIIVATVYVSANMLVEILHPVLDPRTRVA